jgi:hypothetical protein
MSSADDPAGPALRSVIPALRSTGSGLRSVIPWLRSVRPPLRSTGSGLRSVSPPLRPIGPPLRPIGPPLRLIGPALRPIGPGLRSTGPGTSSNPEISPAGRYIAWRRRDRGSRTRLDRDDRVLGLAPRETRTPYREQTGRGALHDREDFIFREDLMHLYDEKLSPRKKSSGSWCPYGRHVGNVGASSGGRAGRWRADRRQLSDMTEMFRRCGVARRPRQSCGVARRPGQSCGVARRPGQSGATAGRVRRPGVVSFARAGIGAWHEY